MRPMIASLFIAFVASLIVGCSAVQPMPDERSPGIIYFEVDPAMAEVYIDDDYRGRIDGWTAQAIPVKPGDKRIELRAEGYITQRFDIDVGAGEQLTLRLRLEPEIEELELDDRNDPKNR